MADTPAISVIMLTYNREALAPRAVESVLSQSFSDFEFIIVDNGSTDCGGAKADEYAARDGRVRVIHKERGNIGSGRNAGLDAAGGEYIAYIDDDDWCEPDFLEFLRNLAAEYDADVAICGASDRAFPDMTVPEAENVLAAAFDVCGHITTLHLTGGGEPFLHPQLPELGDDTIFERAPLERLCADGKLGVYRHEGFWQCMDTQRDKGKLEALWSGGNAPWKVWAE